MRIPVIVGDKGPAYKIGEGSTALLRMLSPAEVPNTFKGEVTFLLFPGTKDKVSDLSPDTIDDVIAKKGAEAAAKVLPP